MKYLVNSKLVNLTISVFLSCIPFLLLVFAKHQLSPSLLAIFVVTSSLQNAVFSFILDCERSGFRPPGLSIIIVGIALFTVWLFWLNFYSPLCISLFCVCIFVAIGYARQLAKGGFLHAQALSFYLSRLSVLCFLKDGLLFKAVGFIVSFREIKRLFNESPSSVRVDDLNVSALFNYRYIPPLISQLATSLLIQVFLAKLNPTYVVNVQIALQLCTALSSLVGLSLLRLDTEHSIRRLFIASLGILIILLITSIASFLYDPELGRVLVRVFPVGVAALLIFYFEPIISKKNHFYSRVCSSLVLFLPVFISAWLDYDLKKIFIDRFGLAVVYLSSAGIVVYSVTSRREVQCN